MVEGGDEEESFEGGGEAVACCEEPCVREGRLGGRKVDFDEGGEGDTGEGEGCLVGGVDEVGGQAAEVGVGGGKGAGGFRGAEVDGDGEASEVPTGGEEVDKLVVVDIRVGIGVRLAAQLERGEMGEVDEGLYEGPLEGFVGGAVLDTEAAYVLACVQHHDERGERSVRGLVAAKPILQGPPRTFECQLADVSFERG